VLYGCDASWQRNELTLAQLSRNELRYSHTPKSASSGAAIKLVLSSSAAQRALAT
jgi:hypothetical protein